MVLNYSTRISIRATDALNACYNNYLEMSVRLIWAIISNIIEEAALLAIMLIGLPELDIELPLWLVILVMALWLVMSIFIYRMGSRALGKKKLVGLDDMVGTRGVAAGVIDPEGQVNIKGELWTACSVSGRIEDGEEIVVVRRNRMKLTVESN